jgi:hypothetical protein
MQYLRWEGYHRWNFLKTAEEFFKSHFWFIHCVNLLLGVIVSFEIGFGGLQGRWVNAVVSVVER